MSLYFDKLSEYYSSDKAEKDNQRFLRQAKNSVVSSIVILGIVFFLIFVIVVISVIGSVL